MAPLLLVLGGGAAYMAFRHFKKKPLLHKAPLPATTKAAVHGDLMAHCNDVPTLKRAAVAFGAEGWMAHAQELLKKAAGIHQMMHGAKDIVERCRAGDQHAMALAKAIGDQARAGSKRAQTSWVLIEDYIKKNPPKAA